MTNEERIAKYMGQCNHFYLEDNVKVMYRVCHRPGGPDCTGETSTRGGKAWVSVGGEPWQVTRIPRHTMVGWYTLTETQFKNLMFMGGS